MSVYGMTGEIQAQKKKAKWQQRTKLHCTWALSAAHYVTLNKSHDLNIDYMREQSLPVKARLRMEEK